MRIASGYVCQKQTTLEKLTIPINAKASQLVLEISGTGTFNLLVQTKQNVLEENYSVPTIFQKPDLNTVPNITKVGGYIVDVSGATKAEFDFTMITGEGITVYYTTTD